MAPDTWAKDRLGALRKEWMGCERCGLHRGRKHLVFGSGNPRADILIIGEGPGEDEDNVGDPFVGQSGDVLNSFLDGAHINRNRDCYISNVVCCRPWIEVDDPRIRGGKRKENRKPSREEREACRPRLLELIYIVDPLIIVAMGKVANSAITSASANITAIRGRLQTAEFEGRHRPIRYPVMPVFHPAFLLRNPAQGPETAWDKTSEDFAEVGLILERARQVYGGRDG